MTSESSQSLLELFASFHALQLSENFRDLSSVQNQMTATQKHRRNIMRNLLMQKETSHVDSKKKNNSKLNNGDQCLYQESKEYWLRTAAYFDHGSRERK